MEKCAQSMLLVAVYLSAARTLKPGHGGFLLLSAAGALDDEEFFVIEAPCKLVSVTLHRWSVVVIHISHLNRL